jgi:hypothetical protein
MKVRELRAVLDKAPDDMEVFLSADEGGNAFHGLSSWGTMVYDKTDRPYYIDMYCEEELNEDYGPSEENRVTGLVLWP